MCIRDRGKLTVLPPHSLAGFKGHTSKGGRKGRERRDGVRGQSKEGVTGEEERMEVRGEQKGEVEGKGEIQILFETTLSPDHSMKNSHQ